MQYGDYIPMRPIKRVLYRECPVDIIIPYHDECDRVLELCKGVWAHTRINPYKIYIVDDASASKTFIYAFRKAPNTVMIRNDTRLGFGASLYEGYKEGKNPWVIFLHSDCKIDRPTWITDLFDSYYRMIGQNVAMVAPRTNNPGISNSLLEAKIGADPKEDVVLKEGFLPLYCSLCRRDLFKHIGGFVRPYPYRGYEDEELAIRMRRYGLLQGVSGKSWVYHEGSATTKKIRDYAQILEENRNLCLQDLKG